MSNFLKLSFLLFLFTAFYLSAAPVETMAANFENPLLKTPNAGCTRNNLRGERFSSDVGEDERVKLCLAIDKITARLNSTDWSPALSAELKDIWQIFYYEPVTLRRMPKNAPSRMVAMAEPFTSGSVGSNFEACVYMRPEKIDADSFFQVLLHELRHVCDFYHTWKNKTKLNSLELERRAFLLMGKITQETSEKENSRGIPALWKESWRNLSSNEISAKREAAVEKYLRGNKFYRDLNQNEQTLDFSFLKPAVKSPSDWQFINANAKKDDERLPDRHLLPNTTGLLPQRIQELNFNLEKPKNPRDQKEILIAALSNEKKIYYGMSNFVYDQKLQLQCWKKGKPFAKITENNTIARTEKGEALVESNLSSQTANTPCVLNYQDLKTDFTETFWASPALEKMPITFDGFVEVDGKSLARYTVHRPDNQLYSRLARQYSPIKPFRVFVGTIFVSTEDGQIVKFWGTSYPEDNITNNHSQNIWGSYSVTALRQKLNINGGIWVTVYIGTVAVANVTENFSPFSYTVDLGNFRQATSDVRIVDDEETGSIGNRNYSAAPKVILRARSPNR